MADNNTYVSKTNLDTFTRALKARLDINYANIKHTHSINDLSFNPGIDYLDYRMLPNASRTQPGVVMLGEGPENAAVGNHTHVNATAVRDGMMSKEMYVKLDSLENYEHPTGDGFGHVPVTGSVSDGQVLTAGDKPGVYRWQALPLVDAANNGIISSDFYTDLNTHINDTTIKHKTTADNKVLASIGDADQLITEAKKLVPAVNELSDLVVANSSKITQIQANISGMAGTLTALTTAAFNRMDPLQYVEGTICYVLDTTGLTVNGKEYNGEPTSFIVVDPDGPGAKEKQWVELSAMTPKMEAGAISYISTSMPSASTVEQALNILANNKLNKNGLVAGKVVIVGEDPQSANPLKCTTVDATVLEYLSGLSENVQVALDDRSKLNHTHVCADIKDLTAMSDNDIAAAIDAAFN